MLYYDSMIFTLHINTWIPLFQSIWIWVLTLMIGLLRAPEAIFLSIPVINAAYYLFALKKAFGYNWVSTMVRWLPAFFIDTFYHWLILLLNAAWFKN
jgi:hypothetical protein